MSRQELKHNEIGRLQLVLDMTWRRPQVGAACAALLLCWALAAVVQESSRHRAVLDQVAENAAAEEAASGAQFPPEQELNTNEAPKKLQPFQFKPGNVEGKHWWWARQPHRQVLASSQGPEPRSKGKKCMDLAKRARSAGLKPGDRKLAKECLKLAKGEERAAQQHVGREIKAKVRTHFNEKKDVPMVVNNKDVTLHLYRPHGFHAV